MSLSITRCSGTPGLCNFRQSAIASTTAKLRTRSQMKRSSAAHSKKRQGALSSLLAPQFKRGSQERSAKSLCPLRGSSDSLDGFAIQIRALWNGLLGQNSASIAAASEKKRTRESRRERKARLLDSTIVDATAEPKMGSARKALFGKKHGRKTSLPDKIINRSAIEQALDLLVCKISFRSVSQTSRKHPESRPEKAKTSGKFVFCPWSLRSCSS